MTPIEELSDQLAKERSVTADSRYRRELALLDHIAKLEARIHALETVKLDGFDPSCLTDEQLQALGQRMYERGSLRETIARAVQLEFETEFDSLVSEYLDKVDIEIECRASIIDRN